MADFWNESAGAALGDIGGALIGRGKAKGAVHSIGDALGGLLAHGQVPGVSSGSSAPAGPKPPPPPPQSLADQIAGLGLPANLLPAEHAQGFAQYVDAIGKINSSKLDKTVKDQLLAQVQQNYQTSQATQAQEPSKLAYQAFYNQTVLPYLQQQQKGTQGTLDALYGDMRANLGNLPGVSQGASRQALDAMQAGSAQEMGALQQSALNQPLLNQMLASISQDISAQQAAQKAAAQAGAVSGAQAIQGAVPGATVSIPTGF